MPKERIEVERPMHYPSQEEFVIASQQWRTIRVWREIHADSITPVGACAALREKGDSFLLESVEGGEKWGRYSIVGAAPEAKIRIQDGRLSIRWKDGAIEEFDSPNPLEKLVQFGRSQACMPDSRLPRFLLLP